MFWILKLPREIHFPEAFLNLVVNPKGCPNLLILTGSNFLENESGYQKWPRFQQQTIFKAAALLGDNDFINEMHFIIHTVVTLCLNKEPLKECLLWDLHFICEGRCWTPR